jgi:hypothetical protein
MIWWCEHIYHKECINELLIKEEGENSKCPMCRALIEDTLDLKNENEILLYGQLKDELRNHNELDKYLEEMILKEDEEESLYLNAIDEFLDEMKLNEEDEIVHLNAIDEFLDEMRIREEEEMNNLMDEFLDESRLIM